MRFSWQPKKTILRKSFFLDQGPEVIIGKPAILIWRIAHFQADIEEEVSTLLSFDIVNMDGSVQEELVDSIKREGKVLYEKI